MRQFLKFAWDLFVLLWVLAFLPILAAVDLVMKR